MIIIYGFWIALCLLVSVISQPKYLFLFSLSVLIFGGGIWAMFNIPLSISAPTTIGGWFLTFWAIDLFFRPSRIR